MLLIDKPAGMSSFDVIRKLRRVAGIRKMGHAGTLDPLASGLLLIAIGDETKQLSQFTGLPKTYDVDVLVGERRDTGDLEGKVIEEKKVQTLPSDAVEQVLSGMIGELPLPVPAYSAVKQNGEPLYRRARRGEALEPPVKPMRIERIVLHEIVQERPRAVIRCTMEVGSGAYVRSIAEEIGRRLEYPTVVRMLRRITVGSFHIDDAIPLGDTEALRSALEAYAGRT